MSLRMNELAIRRCDLPYSRCRECLYFAVSFTLPPMPEYTTTESELPGYAYVRITLPLPSQSNVPTPSAFADAHTAQSRNPTVLFIFPSLNPLHPLRTRGVGLQSLRESIDTTTTQGTLYVPTPVIERSHGLRFMYDQVTPSRVIVGVIVTTQL